jgi:hypothetical protein
VIEWLNTNAGAIQAVTTFVLVGVTAWYVVLTRQMVQATRTSQRPYVYIDVTSDGGGTLELGLGNYGERAAERIEFNVLRQPSQRDGKPVATGTPLERGIRYLPPGRGYRFRVPMSNDVYKGPPDTHVLDVKVTYAHGGTSYEDRLTVDFSDFDGILLKSFRDSGDEIARSVKEIAREAKHRSSQNRFSSMFAQPERKCPACGEYISEEAKKCSRCLEWLPKSEATNAELEPESEPEPNPNPKASPSARTSSN